MAVGRKKVRKDLQLSKIMQTRVPENIQKQIQKDLDRMRDDGIFISEAAWVRQAIIEKLKNKKKSK